MKAKETNIGSKVKDRSGFSAIIIANSSRQGDEVVVIEYDNGFNIRVYNVNDLIFEK